MTSAMMAASSSAGVSARDVASQARALERVASSPEAQPRWDAASPFSSAAQLVSVYEEFYASGAAADRPERMEMWRAAIHALVPSDVWAAARDCALLDGDAAKAPRPKYIVPALAVR